MTMLGNARARPLPDMTIHRRYWPTESNTDLFNRRIHQICNICKKLKKWKANIMSPCASGGFALLPLNPWAHYSSYSFQSEVTSGGKRNYTASQLIALET